VTTTRPISEAPGQDPHLVDPQREAVALLASGAAFDALEPPKRIETHGAIVFLAGDTALKLKKAVVYPFMDLSTVERRRAAADAELAVNRAFAPSIYRDVLPIIRTAEGRVTLGPARGEVIDWVVRMRRFDEDKTFDRLAAADALTAPLVEALARAVAASHDATPVRAASIFIAVLERTLADNASAFAEHSALFSPQRSGALALRLGERLAAGRGAIEERGRYGLVRRCHGDLHLRNVALVDGAPQLFDALEFDDALATGDVLYDLAFLLMDLWERGRKTQAQRLFEAYLEATRREADLGALGLLPLFLSMRATIRAKVTAAQAAFLTGARREVANAEALGYFDAAEAFAAPQAARLVAVGGLSGTGKTTLARAVASGIGAAPGAVILRSDVERKALFGVPSHERLPQTAYGAEVTQAVFRTLRRKAEAVLATGHSVIVDAVFARRDERRAIERVAIGASVPFTGLFLEAPLGIRLARVEGRPADASDAGAAVALLQEDYDLGEMSWARVDAAGDPEQTAAAAAALLARRAQ